MSYGSPETVGALARGSGFRTGSSGLSRDLNRVAVLRLIGASGPIARNQIAQRLGLSPATVTSLTRELLERGVVRVADHAPSRGGRPAVLLELVGGAATALGVKIAPDHLVGVLVNLDGEVFERFELKFDATARDSVEHLGSVLESWIAEVPSAAPLLGVGLGMPGVVDVERGTVSSPMLGWDGLPLSEVLHKRLGLPVLVDNDVNTLAVSERLYGRGREVENFITVTTGRGVGLGIVTGGDIYHGFGGGAGEFGHVAAVDDGPRCSCGRRGCLESVIADPALVADARARGVLSSRQGITKLRALANAGDTQAHEIFATAGGILGRAVAGLVNVLSPELVLVSGEGTEAWTHMADAFDGALRSNIFPPLSGVTVEVDPWDDVKWAIGAAALVLRATFTPHDERQADNSIRAWLLAEPGRVEVVA
ncbi:MAG TPA: ROK family transcriptional regulator [Gaiellaceae bacterium]|nr:ROK family transcriptional regulator [Gaiellaceae bacterium]